MKSTDKNNINFFAKTNFRDNNKAFGIKRLDRRLHTYIIGKTGMGKSTLLKNMVVSDIKAGNNLSLLDPHGDLVEEILDFIPKERLKDVIYFNPGETKYSLGFNILENVDESKRHLVASGVISIFKNLWSESWGPRLEYILKTTILSLLHVPESTLLDIPRMLLDKVFRYQALKYIRDEWLKNFWFNEFERYPHFFRTEAISPI